MSDTHLERKGLDDNQLEGELGERSDSSDAMSSSAARVEVPMWRLITLIKWLFDLIFGSGVVTSLVGALSSEDRALPNELVINIASLVASMVVAALVALPCSGLSHGTQERRAPVAWDSRKRLTRCSMWPTYR